MLIYVVGFILSMMFFGLKVKPGHTILFVVYTVIWPVSMTFVGIFYFLRLCGVVHRMVYFRSFRGARGGHGAGRNRQPRFSWRG